MFFKCGKQAGGVGASGNMAQFGRQIERLTR